MKKFLSVMLTLSLIFSAFLGTGFVANAAGNEIGSAKITAVPEEIAVGQRIEDTMADVKVPEGCTAQTIWWIWERNIPDGEGSYYSEFQPIYDGAFENGEIYLLSVVVLPEEGYALSEEFAFEYAAGIEADAEWIEYGDDGEVALAAAEFATFAFTKQITCIEVAAPTVEPGHTAAVNEVTVYADDEDVTRFVEVYADWYKNEYYEANGELFEEGNSYELDLWVLVPFGYSIAEDVKVHLNGADMDMFSDYDGVFAWYFHSLKAPIENIELQGLPEGNVGETLIDEISIVSDRDDVETFVYWWDEEGNEIEETEFVAGKTYILEIEANFFGDTPLSEEFTFIIDGVEYDATKVNVDYQQAYVEIEYKIPAEPDVPDQPDIPTEPEGEIGDVNDDGTVDIFDVQTLFDYIMEVSGSENADTELIARADVNGDGGVDIFDVQTLFDAVMNA